MNNNLTKVEKIVIIVTIIAVFMIFVGIGYAFFTMNNNKGSTAEITTTSGKMTITYADGGSNLLFSERITPSNEIIVDKTFTLTGKNTSIAGNGLTMPYEVGLKYNSGFSDGMIHYYIKEVNRPNGSTVTINYTGETNQTIPGNDTYTGYSHSTLKKGNKYEKMASGEFPANSKEQTLTFNLIMQFPDTGENQDSEKGKNINAEVIVNYEPEYIVQTIDNLYEKSNKDENKITIDGLQKDETVDFNVTLLNNSIKNYNVSLLNDSKLIAETGYDEYDNIRYVGPSPNNYISFNDEMWRIIGIFNVYNNDTNTTEKLIKIIRNERIGTYSWDTSDTSVNNGNGVNEWSQSDLMKELNTDYLDTSKTSGTTLWYNYHENSKTGTYDYNKNIKSSYIDKIANVRWILGGILDIENTAKNYYIAERGMEHISNPTDGITRTNYWDGKIALMYPSDYGYASTNDTCRDNLSSFTCGKNNWMCYSQNDWQWTLTPNTNYSPNVFQVFSQRLSYTRASSADDVRPVLFLKSNTQITGGTGTSADPYTID